MFKPNPGHRLELHILKSHGVSNLNRDDMGQPKSVQIGGCRRLRISSQSEKYSIRHSDIFQQFLDESDLKYGATRMVRTRHATEYIQKKLAGKISDCGHDPEKNLEDITRCTNSLKNIFSQNDGNKQNEEGITQLIALSKAELDYLTDEMFEITSNEKFVIRDISDTIKKLSHKRTSSGFLSPELQLFGRFTTSSTFFRNIDTPLQVSHGFTVHEARIEQDYWTAVDDLNKESDKTGGGHLDSRSFGAGIFYHYYCLDVPTLTRNILGSFTTLNDSAQVELTADLIAAFLYATICRNPVGSQTNNANHDLPDCIYLTYGNAFPYCAQNAFERPVNMTVGGGFYTEAKRCFIDWIKERKQRYGIFCGYESSMGIDNKSSDLQTLVESAVDQTFPVIRSNLITS